MEVLSEAPMPEITESKATQLLAILLPFERLPWLKHAEIACKLFDILP